MTFDMSKLARLRAGKTELAAKVSSEDQVLTLALNEVKPDPNQPRKHFSEEEIEALANSIKENGLIQPIIVRKEEKDYTIIAGERRWRACQLLKQPTIRAILMKEEDLEKLIYVQMVENLQREDLSIEDICRFIQERMAAGEKQIEIAHRLGIDKARVSHYASWQAMPDILQEAVSGGKISSIETAYLLSIAWEKHPQTVEDLIKKADFISRSDARALLKSYAGATFGDKKVNSDTSDSQSTCVFDPSFNDKKITESHSEANRSGDLMLKESDLEVFKNACILISVDGREGELLYKQKVKDGFVIVRWEDGTQATVEASSITLNRIIEG